MENSHSQNNLLGSYSFDFQEFNGLDKVFSQFDFELFKSKNIYEKGCVVSFALMECIQKSPDSSFLLYAVVQYIERISRECVLDNYTLSSFELWLNQFSMLNKEENYQVRAKIVGKLLPRDAYQVYFPIGMGKEYPGTHFVTAHNSPDLDTTVASFWGWMDAFSARVAQGLHIWNIPGGIPVSQIEIDILFKDIFGSGVFDYLAKTRLSLTLTSLDLVTQSGMIRKEIHEPAPKFDGDRQRHAVVLVNKQGYYLGDWRTIDLEGVRQVIISFNNCIMWFESHLHIQLIACFSKPILKIQDLSQAIKRIVEMKFSECEPAKEFSSDLFSVIDRYLKTVLLLENGMDSSFEQFSIAMKKLGIANFTQIAAWLRSLLHSELFDDSGCLTENRPLIFNQLEVLVNLLSEAFSRIRKYVDSLEVAFKIKTEVFGFVPQFLSHRTDFEEIRAKMDNYASLTVNQVDQDGKLIPIGVIYSQDLQDKILGTVTLRDFCNREEMKIPSYLQVISVIDHHKVEIGTDYPPHLTVSDVQSSNTLLAEKAFVINDQYSLGGMTKEPLDAQLLDLRNNHSSLKNLRIYRRLLQRKHVLERGNRYFVDADREMVEYLHFIYAILDDTDLLTKVSRSDIDCIASLLNRMKSLLLKKEVEIVDFDDLADDDTYTQKAAMRLLHHADFYSLYSKVYALKELRVESVLDETLKGGDLLAFVDTKILNYSNRIGQTKLFACNYEYFMKHAQALRKLWYEKAVSIYANNREIMLHMHVMSTISSAEELFSKEDVSYHHKDEMWLWIPCTELAIEKLKLFLNGFKNSKAVKNLELELECFGPYAQVLMQIFKESFLPVSSQASQESDQYSLAILRYNAGGLNSRKSMIAPYLPTLN